MYLSRIKNTKYINIKDLSNQSKYNKTIFHASDLLPFTLNMSPDPGIVFSVVYHVDAKSLTNNTIFYEYLVDYMTHSGHIII